MSNNAMQGALGKALRISRLANGTWRIQDFNAQMDYTVEELEAGMQTKITLMQMLDDGEDIDDIGFRYSRDIFYIYEKIYEKLP